MTETVSTDEGTAVRYEQDGDGIVTLTLDDPTASANTMNELYVRSMHAAVDRLYDEVEGVTGVVIASAKKTFFAGGNLTLMMRSTPEDAASVFAGAGSSRPSRVVVPSGKIHSLLNGVRISPMRCSMPFARNPPNTSRPRTEPSASATSTLNAAPL